MKKLAMIIAIAGLMLIPVLASADMVSYTTTINKAGTTWNNPLSFTKFDPSLGTLSQVSLSLSSTMDSTLQLVGSNGQATSGTAWTTLTFNITGDPNNVMNSSTAISFPSPVYSYSIVKKGSATLGGTDYTKTNFWTISSSAGSVLAEFTGLGTTSFLFADASAVGQITTIGTPVATLTSP